MSDEAALDYESMTKPELQDELRSRGLSAAGNKPDLVARLQENDAAPEDLTKAQLAERAAQLGIEDFPANGNKQEMIDAINSADSSDDADPVDDDIVNDPQAKQAALTGGDQEQHDQVVDELAEGFDESGLTVDQDELGVRNTDVSRFGLIERPLGPDGQPLQGHFEPADVAAPPDTGHDELDARMRAHAASRAADARAMGITAVDGEDGPITMGQVEVDDGGFDKDKYPDGGFTEATIPSDQRRMSDLRAWAEANPDATVIPPALLPPAYQDPTIVTPGLPGERIV